MREGFKQTDIGLIPHDWEPYTVGELVDFFGGSQPDKSTFVHTQRHGYIRLIQIRDYKTDRFLTYIPEHLARKKCDTQDIMIGRYGPPIFQILRGIDGAYNVALIKAVPNEKLDREFFYYFIKNEKLFALMDSLSRRSSGQTGVELPALREYPLALPKIPEQKEIAKALSDVDELIVSLEKLIAKKRDIKTATMQHLLTGKKRLPGFGEGKGYKQTELGEIPEDWDLLTLGEIRDLNDGWSITGGPFGSNLKSSDYTETGVRIIQLQNIGDGEFHDDYQIYTSISKANELLSCNIYPNEIIISKMGDPVARACIIPSAYDRYVMCSDGIRLKIDPQKHHAYFIFLFLNSKYFRTQAIAASTGSTRQRIGLTELKALKLFCPPQREQKEIAEIVESMDKEIGTLCSELEKINALKQGMMQELLTGRTRLVKPQPVIEEAEQERKHGT